MHYLRSLAATRCLNLARSAVVQPWNSVDSLAKPSDLQQRYRFNSFYIVLYDILWPELTWSIGSSIGMITSWPLRKTVPENQGLFKALAIPPPCTFAAKCKTDWSICQCQCFQFEQRWCLSENSHFEWLQLDLYLSLRPVLSQPRDRGGLVSTLQNLEGYTCKGASPWKNFVKILNEKRTETEE